MKKFVAQLLLIFSVTTITFSQTAKDEPVLVNEFTPLSTDDWMAQTDSAIIAIYDKPNLRITVQINGGTADYYSTAYDQGSLIAGYWTKNRGISSDRFNIIFCNVNKEDFRIKLFVHSRNYRFPECPKNSQTPKNTVLFERVRLTFDKKRFMPIEQGFVDVSGTEGDYSKFAITALADFLKKSPASKVIILGYLSAGNESTENSKTDIRKIDKKFQLPKILIPAKKLLLQYGVKPSQIRLIDGGYMNYWKELQFWFVPEGGKIPKPEPDYVPEKKISR